VTDFATLARAAAAAATGRLGWSPELFWAATPAELKTALQGLAEAAGVAEAPAPLGRDELARLRKDQDDGRGA
jgi:hypothetical protein